MSLNAIARQWGYLLLIASLSAIIVATIYPFQFVVPEGFTLKSIAEEFAFGSAIKDYLQNILLFIPFGISLAAIYERDRRSILLILTVCCLVSATISTAVEVTQFFLPVRISNLTDIIYNSLGGTLGGVVCCWRSNITKFALGVVRADPQQLSLKSLLVAIAGYCFLVILGVGVLVTSVNLSNWDDDFYLAIGNEVTGDRPWQGYIYNLYISDRSLEPSQIKQAFEQTESVFTNPSLVTALDFSQVQYYRDLKQQIPNLLWQSSLESDRGSKSSGVLLNSQQWLKTAEPARYLNNRLKKTGEFSLFIAISTDDLVQTGPARIISLSEGIYNRNLFIGQEKDSLRFRLRTPITGSNGTQPEFTIPEVFVSNTVQQMIITFAANRLNIYLDNDSAYSFEFPPSTSFIAYFPWQKQNWTINLINFNLDRYQQYFYTLTIFPLGILIFTLLHYLVVNQSSAKSSD